MLRMPKPGKPEMTKFKHQITNKFQISNKIRRQLFWILNFGHCDLFGICVLLFEIFITETLYETTPKWHSFMMIRLSASATGYWDEP
jgi:hypothetical protein